jgi:ABC-2 type transport system ATP-binding protein
VRGPEAALDEDLESKLVGRRVYEGGFEGLTDKVEAVRALGDGRLALDRASLEDIMVYNVREDYHAHAAL